MLSFWAGLMISNLASSTCVPNAGNDTDDADPGLRMRGLSRSKVVETQRQWRRARLTKNGFKSLRGDPHTIAKKSISNKQTSLEIQQKHHLQNYCQVNVAWQSRGQRKVPFGDVNGVGAFTSQPKFRFGNLQKGLGIQSRALEYRPRATFGADFALATTKRRETAAKAISSSQDGSLLSFLISRKDSNSKCVMNAVTGDREALKDEGEDIYGFQGTKDVDGKEKSEEKTSRIGGRILGSYASTTAFAIKDSLPPEGFVVLMSCAVGLMTGACVVLFNLAVHEIHDIVWDGIPDTGATWLRCQALETTWQQTVFIPAGGGALVGILKTLRTTLEGSREEHSFWRHTKGFARQVLKTGAAAITLGTGNSLGPEGPSVEIGESIANGVTTVLRNSRERKLSLVAAGSAAGISSGFNAAVAGCFFAVESVLPGLSSEDSAPSLTTAMVLLSSVLASVVSQAGLGSDPAFRIPAYDFRSPTELPLYLLLGVLCGGVSFALVKGTVYATTMFESLQKATGLPMGFLPPLGGLSVGIIALAYPEVLYWGFKNVDVLLEAHLPWIQGPPAILLLQLVGAKLVATSLCRGSGLVGGMYAPSLFIGAALGSAYGSLASYASTQADPMWHLNDLQVAAPQAYALVGMAATLAGVCQVPLTSVLLLFEITRDYRIILPLMAAVGLSSWVASTLQKKRSPTVVRIAAPITEGDVVSMTAFMGGVESRTVDAVLITNLKQPSPTFVPLISGHTSIEDALCLANVEISEDRLTEELLVVSAMRTKFTGLTGDISLREAMSRMLAEKEWCVLIMNQDNHLEGLLTLSDIQLEAEKARSRGLVLELEKEPISSLCRSVSAGGEIQVVTTYPDTTLKVAQRLMAGRGLRQIPVVAHSKDSQGKHCGKHVLGLLDREGIKLACRAEATRRILCFHDPLDVHSVPDEANVSE